MLSSKKAETRPFAEYNPLCVHPITFSRYKPFTNQRAREGCDCFQDCRRFPRRSWENSGNIGAGNFLGFSFSLFECRSACFSQRFAYVIGVVREGVVAGIMPQHIRAPEFLSCCFDCCLALHFFLPQSVVHCVLWNHCSWLQVRRQCNHSICTLHLSTATHSAAHNDPPPPTHCKLHFEKLRKFCGNFRGKLSKIVSTEPAKVAEIRRNVRKFFRRKLVQQMLCRMRAAARTHFPPDTASENGS